MDDWAPGDQALCIKIGPWRIWDSEVNLDYGPQCGHIYKVKDVNFDDHTDTLFLSFPEWPIDEYHAIRFVKVNPLEEDEFDKEVINIMIKEKETA